MAEHYMTLTNGGAFMLRSILQAPEALTSLKHKFDAGKLLSDELDKLDDLVKKATPKGEEIDASFFLEEFPQLELTEGEREACKAATKWAIENGRAPAGKQLNSIITQLGLLE